MKVSVLLVCFFLLGVALTQSVTESITETNSDTSSLTNTDTGVTPDNNDTSSCSGKSGCLDCTKSSNCIWCESKGICEDGAWYGSRSCEDWRWHQCEVNGKYTMIGALSAAGLVVVLVLMCVCCCCCCQKKKKVSKFKDYNEFKSFSGEEDEEKEGLISKTPKTDQRRQELLKKYKLGGQRNADV